VDTLAVLRERYSGAEFFVVLGLDQAAQFVHWHQSDQILAWAQLAIAARPGHALEKLASPEWHNPQHLHLNMPLMPLSATDIRQRCRTGEDLTSVLSASVIQYIQNNHLYLDHHDRSL
jgi:nicotinate-nucleotide adenylyltransferase